MPGIGWIVVVAAIVVRDGRVLAMRRASTKDAGAGLWETISGRVERDEDPLDAVRREIAEESGLEVRIDPRPITAYAARRADVPMLVIVYRAEHVAGEVVRSDEHDEHAWLTADELAERSPLAKLVAAVRACLADVRKVRGRSP